MSEAGAIPRHIAIIMDGNGRWASRQGKIRTVGHQAGVDALRQTVQACGDLGVEALTVFAFSSENWRRPRAEVSVLMGLFAASLANEIRHLKARGVRLRFLGDRAAFSQGLQTRIARSEALTAANTTLNFQIAANYGGRWDIVQAVRQVARRVVAGELTIDAIDESTVATELSLAALPPPDLFIRTGGERRISNYLLWDLAYSELYFTDTLWPDFDREALMRAIAWFRGRERRFGKTGEQVQTALNAASGGMDG